MNTQQLELAKEFRNHFLADDHASIVLPAGCGKTEILASTVASAAADGERVLVLTHTNAGVSVIRRRLRTYAASAETIGVSTIDSFMQRVALAFPTLGSPLGLDEDSPEYWPTLRQVATEVVGRKSVLETMNSSYDLVVVDEYQDCSHQQHSFVSWLASQVRCLVLGDPLQAIFGFGGVVLVDWDQEVVPTFPQVQEAPFVQRPWRWKGRNEALGEWLLMELRPSLEAGSVIALNEAPGLVWAQSSPQALQGVHFEYLPSASSTVFVLPAKHRVRPFAKGRKGRFPALENRQMSAAVLEAKRLDAAGTDGGQLAAAVVKAVNGCASGVTGLVSAGSLQTLLGRLEAGPPLPTGGHDDRKAVRVALNALKVAGSSSLVLDALRTFWAASDIHVYARDCLRDIIAAAEGVSRGDYSDYAEAVCSIRAVRKHAGPASPPQCSAHTLLIKGLEFDRCIVIDAHELQSREHLYVALTRGSDHLKVLSSGPGVQFPSA